MINTEFEKWMKRKEEMKTQLNYYAFVGLTLILSSI
jgi:hypothetical protein